MHDQGQMELTDYIKGRISAAMSLICRNVEGSNTNYSSYDIIEVDDRGDYVRTVSTTFTVKTDQEHYDEFVRLMHDWYPMIKFVFDSDQKE